MDVSTPQGPSRVRSAARWFDVRHRGVGTWAYALNRITGLALVGYLYLHLVVLSLLVRPATYDRFVDVVRSPLFLVLDVILIAGWLIHALNGLRLTVVGLGFGVRAQRVMLVAATVVGLAALLVATVLVFGG